MLSSLFHYIIVCLVLNDFSNFNVNYKQWVSLLFFLALLWYYVLWHGWTPEDIVQTDSSKKISTSRSFINQFLRFRSKRNPVYASQIIHHDECLQGRTPAVGRRFGNLTYGLKEQSPEEKKNNRQNGECSKTLISSQVYERENVRGLIKIYEPIS